MEDYKYVQRIEGMLEVIAEAMTILASRKVEVKINVGADAEGIFRAKVTAFKKIEAPKEELPLPILPTQPEGAKA